jgi:hypothetical protein
VTEFGLGAYLVERGVLSREQVEQALQAQTVYGGRLGTNLVELGLLSLDDVGEHLAASSGFAVAPKEWLEAPDEMALAAVPRELAERHKALPLRIDAAGLHVAFLDPEEERVRGAIARAVRRPVRPYVLPELRMLYLLERHLGIARPVRFMNVARRLERVRRRAAADDAELPEEVRLRAELGIRPLASDEDLIDESSFAELHQRLNTARERAQGGPPPGAAASDADDELLLDEALPEDGAKAAEPASVAADALALEEELASAADRDAAARAALALALRHVRAAALFVVHRGMVMGLLGAGEALEPRIEGILVPADADSIFARVVASGEVFRGAPPATGLDARVLRALGRAGACELALLPIAMRGRVVNLLYVDGGPRPIAATALGALRALADCVAHAYEQLILQRKKRADV